MLTLAETKLHLRVDHDDEDVLIDALMATATAACADYLNMPAEDLVVAVPAPIKSAALLLAGNLYANRESMGERPFHKNPAFEALLNPYRVHA
ncbi:DNA packaging protein [Acidovorax carolinensis]|uniref:DNA packaging protein n=1 Tax=Acidovorax carolinensis TaxID=553814 RepID=A0A240UC72_9BURK|nr:head-tail connector protein [Acidovorax carolinensis]ART55510.1 DNA packaging protein [Acidovorax carolinensis]ART58652.1 DNA packaging protein [Acidovorax carolinensis]